MSDHYIKEAAALLDQAKGALSAGADKAKEMAGDPDVQKLLPYLLAGGAGAVGGAALSGRRKKRSGETRGQYLTRILRNALVAGGLAGGGSYLATKGFQKTLGSADLENPLTGKEGDQGPVASFYRSSIFSYPLAALAGGGTLVATRNNKLIGANPDQGNKLLTTLKQTHGGQLPEGIASLADLEAKQKTDPSVISKWLSGAAEKRYKDLKGGGRKLVFSGRAADPAIAAELRRLAAEAGINVHTPGTARHTAHELANPLSKILGRTTGRRVGRGALGLGAALIPTLIGSLTTNAPE